MLIKTLAVLVLAMPLFSSAAEPKKVKLRNNGTSMKKEVSKIIPVGSSIEHAMEVMEQSGFTCEMLWDQSFFEVDAQENHTTHTRIDFLYCDKEKPAFPYICTRRWQIAIVHKKGNVAEVLVSIGLICP